MLSVSMSLGFRSLKIVGKEGGYLSLASQQRVTKRETDGKHAPGLTRSLFFLLHPLRASLTTCFSLGHQRGASLREAERILSSGSR